MTVFGAAAAMSLVAAVAPLLRGRPAATADPASPASPQPASAGEGGATPARS